MAKKKVVSQKRKNQGPKKVKSRKAGPPGMYLDGAAMAHIHLMADPCQGRLVPAAYPTSGGGAIQRFRTVVPLGVGAGETAGFFHWLPGQNEYYANGASGPTNPFTPTAVSNIALLTHAFNVGASAPAFRCLAACIRVIPNSSESNRGGIVYGGQTDGAYYGNNGTGTITVNEAISGLPVSARMPAKSLEILWCPNDVDQNFTSDSTNSGSAIYTLQSGGAVSFGFTGGPSASGVTLELTAVYEINFRTGGSQVSKGPPVSMTPWNQVLKGFYNAIQNAPVIIDTARGALEYIGTAANSQPGRVVMGAARLALAM